MHITTLITELLSMYRAYGNIPVFVDADNLCNGPKTCDLNIKLVAYTTKAIDPDCISIVKEAAVLIVGGMDALKGFR